jgi:hypothetical protein
MRDPEPTMKLASIRKALVGSCTAVLLAGTPRAASTQTVYAPNTPGKWEVARTPLAPGGTLSPADLAAVKALDLQVYGIFRQAPILATPTGFDVHPHSNFAREDMDGNSDSPLPKVVAGTFNVQLAPYIVENGRTFAFSDIVIGWIAVDLNKARCLNLNRMTGEDAGGQFYRDMPDLKRDAHGYLGANGCVLLTHRTEPLLIPVTRERYLKWQVADARKKYAESEPDAATKAVMAQHPDDEGFKQQIRGRQSLKQYADAKAQALAALTPAERSAPAWVQLDPNVNLNRPDANPYDTEPLTDATAEGARVVWAYNPKFFDRTLAAAAPQLLAVSAGRIAIDSDIGQRSLGQLDWRALEALLK